MAAVCRILLCDQTKGAKILKKTPVISDRLTVMNYKTNEPVLE